MLKIAGFTFFSRVFAAILTLIIVIFISRYLGPSERGVCSLYLLIVSLSGAISEMAGGAASAFLLKRYSADRLHKVQMLWSLAPSIIVPFIFFVFKAISDMELIIIIISCWVHNAWLMQQNLFLGLKKFLFFNGFQILAPGLTLCLFFILYNFFPNRYSYYFSTLISWLLLFCAGLFLLKIKFKMDYFAPKTSKGSIREIFKMGSTNQLGHVVSLLNARLLFLIFPAVELGIWSNTLNLAEGLFMIAGSLGQVLYSMLAGNTVSSPNNTRWFRNACISNLTLTIIGGIVIVLIPDNGWTYLFGPGFAGIQNLLKIILIGIIFQSMFLIFSYRLSADGLFSKNVYALFWGAGSNILITLYFLISKNYSVENGAFALAIGWVTSSVAAFIYLKKAIPDLFQLKNS